MQGRILIDNQPHELFSHCPSAFLYEERALLLATEKDIVVLRKRLPIEYIDFISNSRNLNVIYLKADNERQELAMAALSPENMDMLNSAISARPSVNYVIQSYIPNRGIMLLAQQIGLSVYGESFYQECHTKSATETLCKQLGFRVIPSIYLESSKIDLTNYYAFLNIHQTVIAKPEIGLGGNIKVLSSTAQIIPDEFFPAIVQAYYESEWEGSIQFYNQQNEWVIYFCDTLQADYKFIGFTYPSILEENNAIELEVAADRILKHMSSCYEDLPSFGIDYLVHSNTVFFHDLNPRQTAVTYVFSLLHNLYGIKEVSNMHFQYVQFQINHEYTYYELRTAIENLGIAHLSNINKEGYAILYPGMIDECRVNILIVSRTNRVNEYYEIIEKCLSTI